MTLELVVFDLDGTLVDSTADIAAAMNHTLELLGHEAYPVDRYPEFIGAGARQLVELALAAQGAQGTSVDRAFALFQARYREHLVVQTTLFSGVAGVLHRLSLAGVGLAVLSNKPQLLSEIMVKRLLADVPFKRVLGQREGVPRKPDPTALIELAVENGCGMEQTAMVGDSPIDMETAKRAGAVGVGVSWSGACEASLLAAGAGVVVGSSAELLAAFASTLNPPLGLFSETTPHDA